MPAPEERFSQGDSVLHRLDPRAKMIGAVLLTLSLALAESLVVSLLGLLAGLLLLILAKLPPGSLLRRLFLVNTFTFFLWVMLPLTYGGDALFSLAGMDFSLAGIQLASRITLKTNALLCVILALLATSPMPDIGRALSWWKVPEKFCWLLLFSYRYLFVIYDEYVRLRRAATMRCFVPGTNLATYRTFGYLIGMTLVHSYNRSRRVGQAMTLRCFQGRFHALDWPKATSIDMIWGIALVCGALYLFVLDHYPTGV